MNFRNLYQAPAEYLQLLARLPFASLAGSSIFFLAMGQIAYFTERQNFEWLFGWYTAAFASFLLLASSPWPLKYLLWVAAIARLLLLLAVPGLSDDYFRFIWDGQLLNAGINPFLYLPSEIADNPALAGNAVDQRLFGQMNSPDYHTIYPPVAQLVFAVSAWFAGGKSLLPAIIVMRFFMLVADAGSVYFMLKLLRHFGLPARRVLLFALNPLVVQELVGNLHFEGVMIAFLTGCLWWLVSGRIWLAALFLAFSVASKMLPLMFLPLCWQPLGNRRFVLFASAVLGLTALLFAPFLLNEQLLRHLGGSVGLYFQKFEFNASVYYLFRQAGYMVRDFNVIQTVGSRLSLFTVYMLAVFSFFGRHHWQAVFTKMLLGLSVYFFLATIVHPWYVTGLLALVVLAPFRYPIVWSFATFFSYSTYRTAAYTENLWLVSLEYLMVYAVIFAEILICKKAQHLRQKGQNSTFY